MPYFIYLSKMYVLKSFSVIIVVEKWQMYVEKFTKP